MFIDEIKIYARAGHGGRGCVAFHRETRRPKGGPAGGNGGRGGDVVLEADHDLNNLVAQYYNPRLLAPHGGHGLGKGMDGAAGKDLLVKVPCGTLVWSVKPSGTENGSRFAESSAPASLTRRAGGEQALEIDLATDLLESGGHPPIAKGALVADLTEHGHRLVLCKGGRGGLGNRNFATATRQAPRFAQPGESGEAGEFLLELRVMADVGLVGYPNAGKSTLLAAISKARPKIAPYPFTTLHPHVGTVDYPDHARLTVCDAPGLIAGAHRNVGLGHAFLRHIQRCKCLVLLLDMAGTDGRLPWDDYQQLLNELRLYERALLDKPRRVVANKMDVPAAENNLKLFKRKIRRTPVLPIAAACGQGLEKFKQLIREAVSGGMVC